MDYIIIRDLTVNVLIGTLPEERAGKQKLLLNLVIGVDLSVAGHSDDLNDSVDYSLLEREVRDLAENSSFFLLEKLGETLCAKVLSHRRIREVELEIDKPGAARFSRSIAIRMIRRNAIDR